MWGRGDSRQQHRPPELMWLNMAQASLARVEPRKGRDPEMTEAFVTNNADNVKPRIEESREDSTEAQLGS